MSRADLVNGAALVVALAGSVAAAYAPVARRGATAVAAVAPSSRPLVDATGTALPGKDYQRIASATSIADRLLLEVCDPRRILAFTSISAEGPEGHRYAGKSTVQSIDRVEAILQLAPDVLVVSNVGDPRRVARLREAGLHVFDVGIPAGWASLQGIVEDLAALCGDRREGTIAWRRLDARAEALAAAVPPDGRPSAMVLTTYGGRFYGGTVGSSYHDVLRLAGLRDVAADDHRGAPQLSVEAILALDPAWLVTKEGQRAAICRRRELTTLRACARGQVVEVEGTSLDDPGLGILEAATAVHAAVFAAPRGGGEPTD